MKLVEPTQYNIEELFIQTKGGKVPIDDMFEEINLFDSLFLPVASGNILIVDAKQLSKRLSFDGSEVISMSINKGIATGFASFKKAFRIYKQSDRKNINQTSESYILHFVSDELFISDQDKVNQSYETTYSDIINKILTKNLKVPGNSRGAFEQSYGIRKVVIPNLTPLDAIEWCAKRAMGPKNSPEFIFFCNAEGYNFVSLSTLLTKRSILNVNFSPKNVQDDSAFLELSSARSFEVLSQDDLIDKIRSGVNAGTFLGFDPVTRTFGSKEFSFDDVYKLIEHANKNSINTEIHNRDKETSTRTTYDSKQALSVYNYIRGDSNYVKQSDPTTLSKNESYEMILTQRRSILSNLLAKRLKITMPGNFQLTSGKNIDFKTPGFGAHQKGKDNEDLSLSGKYIITGTRHIIGLTRHVTIIEVASDSTNNPANYVSSPEQNELLKSYNKSYRT
jgi:hypothetical protein